MNSSILEMDKMRPRWSMAAAWSWEPRSEPASADPFVLCPKLQRHGKCLLNAPPAPLPPRPSLLDRFLPAPAGGDTEQGTEEQPGTASFEFSLGQDPGQHTHFPT